MGVNEMLGYVAPRFPGLKPGAEKTKPAEAG